MPDLSNLEDLHLAGSAAARPDVDRPPPPGVPRPCVCHPLMAEIAGRPGLFGPFRVPSFGAVEVVVLSQ